MAEYIDRQAAIDVCNKLARENFTLKDAFRFYLGALHDAADDIKALPTADVQPVRHGKWEERKVSDKNCIDEWQTAYCSVCHKYHTTPYMYYFDNYNYCPNCGARMDGET